jgi:hypothetical protein
VAVVVGVGVSVGGRPARVSSVVAMARNAWTSAAVAGPPKLSRFIWMTMAPRSKKSSEWVLALESMTANQ